MNSAYRDKGFTLVEMLVTIAISAIAGAVAVPSAVRLVQHYQLVSSANDVAFEISRAKMQAVGQSRFVRVITGGGGRMLCRQVANSQAGPWAPASCDTSAEPVSLPGTAYVSGTGPIFNRNGLATLGGAMTVMNGVGQKTVTYTMLGRVTIS